MAGIYIHIPFCRSRCVYCGFYSTTSLELRQRYVDAVCREMELRGERIESSEERISTIYLGGGTPSQLTIEQLRQLFIYINKVYPLTSNTEITIEVNPDDVTVEFAAVLQQFPINRVSMGIQTFDDQRLRFLHRRHTATQAIEAVDRLRAAGFQNISIDLMYGFPGETLADWEADIEAALALNVEHLSAYCLMIEEGTPLHQLYRRYGGTEVREYENSPDAGSNLAPPNPRTPAPPTEETERQMYYTLIDRLAAAGYEHYEISNFARPDFRSRHNSSYWNGTPYIGLGAAAHSYDGRSRSWNVADITAYIEGIEQGKRLFEEELLDDDTRYNDTITVALRTKEGLDLSLLSDKHKDYCMKNARRYLDDGLLELTSHLRLTRRGLFVSDMVMSDLMMV
ncbi:MAG: radical SAM family heme chaperone HemW [Prevotella sp.]|nr:radical SAM family heme chaperone HemW [Prevotella sp.]